MWFKLHFIIFFPKIMQYYYSTKEADLKFMQTKDVKPTYRETDLQNHLAVSQESLFYKDKRPNKESLCSFEWDINTFTLYHV